MDCVEKYSTFVDYKQKRMKKPLLSFSLAQSWNKMLRKFVKLFKRFEILRTSEDASSFELNHLQRKMQSLFNRLSKMQSRVGIKIAGSAVALMLMSTSLSAQTYTNDGPVTGFGESPIDVGQIALVAAGDIDGDGNLDLVIGSYMNSISLYKGNSTGGFSYEGFLEADGADIPSDLLPSPTLVDFDNDGDLDLYVGLYDGTIKTYLNNGFGVFSAGLDMTAGATTIDVGSAAAPTFADIDNDGDLDLYAGNNNGTIQVYTNNGSGVFSAAPNLQAGGIDITVGDFSLPVFGDLDDDGDLDLFLGDRYGLVQVFSNNGSGVFAPATNVQSSGVDINVLYFSRPVFADIDTDADLDLLVGGTEGDVSVFLNNGFGILNNSSDLTAENQGLNFDQLAAPAFADLDNDGDLDMFVGDYYGKIATLNNNGSGAFSIGPNLMAAGVELSVGNFAMPEFADLDEDGDMDLYVGNNYGYIAVFKNNGFGVFDASVNLQAGGVDIDAGSMSSPEFADLNGDGDLDLYVGNSAGTMLIFENDGTGLFTAATTPLFVADGVTLAAAGGYSSPLFFDIDDDGDLDLLVGAYGGEVNKYISNSGIFNAAATNFQADGLDVDVYLLSMPEMVNIDGGCGPDLYLGGYQSPIFHYNYKDTLAPTIVCPADVTYNLLQYQSYYTVSGTMLDPISAGDNCNIESVLNDFNGNATLAGIDFPAGTETITWTVTDVDGNTHSCSVDVIVNTFNAIDDLSAIGVSMYPNPSEGLVTIENAQNFNVLISDAFGKTIFNYANVQDAKFVVDLTHQPAGIYFITVSNETEMKSAKMVIE